jgi:hypothetical protein
MMRSEPYWHMLTFESGRKWIQVVDFSVATEDIGDVMYRTQKGTRNESRALSSGIDASQALGRVKFTVEVL